jgi:MraZ protein
MFVGKYEVRLDSKNRVIVPQRLRESRGEGGPLWSKFYLTPGTEGCIFVYTPEGFGLLMEEMGATQQMADASMRTVQRLMAGGADQRECDSQGRIVLSDELRVHAGIVRDAIWVGAVNRAEIWDKERWSAYNKKNISQLGEKMDMVSRAGLALPQGADQTRRGPQV